MNQSYSQTYNGNRQLFWQIIRLVREYTLFSFIAAFFAFYEAQILPWQ
jgi:hypothetical protein